MEVISLKKVYILSSASMLTDLSSVKLLKLNQFINLLATFNISMQCSSTLPHESVLSEYRLLFIDVESFKDTSSIPDAVLKLTKHYKIALFNAQPELLNEKLVLLAGIYGVLYSTDRVDIILRGIENLLTNERWFKRETMHVAIDELLTNSSTIHKNNFLMDSDKILFPALTKRENTIIKLVSSGAQNKEIANQLHISPNTVKTHIYSIFRKTSSRNRIELVTWTKQFL